MLNSFNATGRVAQKTANHTALGAPYVKFVLAIARRKDKNGEIKTDFIPCAVFGNSAKFFADYIEVGNFISISGAMQSSNYEKDGKRMTSIECFVTQYDLIPIQAKTTQSLAPAPAPVQQPAPAAQQYEPIPVPPMPQDAPPENLMPFDFYGY